MKAMDGEPILKKTLVTVAAMVGAWVAFVGTVSLVAVVVTSHAVGAPESRDKDAVADPADQGGKGDASHLPAGPGAKGHSTTAVSHTRQAI